jgi:hypothetical protein
VQQDDQWRALEGSCACAAAAEIKQPLLCRWGMLVQEQEGLLDSVERDTEGVMSRVSASMYKLQDVLKKMKFCTQLIIIVVLFVILIGMLFYTFSPWRFLDTVVNAKVRECPVRSGLILTIASRRPVLRTATMTNLVENNPVSPGVSSLAWQTQNNDWRLFILVMTRRRQCKRVKLCVLSIAAEAC